MNRVPFHRVRGAYPTSVACLVNSSTAEYPAFDGRLSSPARPRSGPTSGRGEQRRNPRHARLNTLRQCAVRRHCRARRCRAGCRSSPTRGASSRSRRPAKAQPRSASSGSSQPRCATTPHPPLGMQHGSPMESARTTLSPMLNELTVFDPSFGVENERSKTGITRSI